MDWSYMTSAAPVAEADAGRRRYYLGRRVTLRGEPARIVEGLTPRCACVRPLDRFKPCLPMSWAVVYRICNEHGARFE